MNRPPEPERHLLGGSPRSVHVPAKVARFLDNLIGDGRARFRGIDAEMYEVLLALHVSALEHREAQGPISANVSAIGNRPLPQAIQAGESDCSESWPDHLDTVAAAELLGCSPRNVRYLALNGHLPGDRVGKNWTFARDVVEGYIAKRTNER